MAYETILFAVDQGVARLTLNRPDRLNSFTAAMHGEVADALTAAENPAVRVLLLTGAGRGFCAGGTCRMARLRRVPRRSIWAIRSSNTTRR